MKKYFSIQTLVLAAGTVFAWYTVYQDYARFYNIEGTIFKIQDCVLPNPVTTPCFWGAWAFLIGLIWSWKLMKRFPDSTIARKQKNLVLFLVAGTIFAWTNAIRGIISFYENQGKPTIGCSGLLVTSPFTTACFYGSVLFLASLLAAVVTLAVLIRRKQKESQNQEKK